MHIKTGKNKRPEPEVTVLRKRKNPKTQEQAEGTPRDVHAGHQRGDGKRVLA